MMDKIENIICALEGISPKELKGFNDSRKSQYREVRQIVMYFSKEMTRMTWEMIGEYYEKDHTTAMHGHKTIKNLIETDRSFREKISKYQEHLDKIKVNRILSTVQYDLLNLERDILFYEEKIIQMKETMDKLKRDYPNLIKWEESPTPPSSTSNHQPTN